MTGSLTSLTNPAPTVDRYGSLYLQRVQYSGDMTVEDEKSVAGALEAAGSAPTVRDAQGKELVAACLAGDRAAQACFQEQFGPLIYRFAAHFRGSTQIEPGDFYLYLFEHNRLYRRLRSYEGRASLRAFLRSYTLPDLFRRFRQIVKKETIDTISLDHDSACEPADPGPGDPSAENEMSGSDPVAGLFAQLAQEKRLLVRLLYIEDFAFSPEDIQLLAERSNRSVREAAELIEQARESVRTREAARRQKLDQAESAAQWILRYERRLGQIATDLRPLSTGSAPAERLRNEQAELTRKLAWREQQRERAFADTERATVTLRYREIARLLNAPMGSISAQITRLRQELLDLAAQRASQRRSNQEEQR